jgi:hypothetical protein
VPDEATRAATVAALASLWPDASVEVVVGTPGQDDVGLHTVDGEVRLVRDGRVLAAAAAGPEEAVVLVRSWLREHARAIGWVPEVDAEVTEPEPALVFDVTPDDEPLADTLLPGRQLHLGLGLRDAMLQPGFPDAILGSGQWALGSWHAVGGAVFVGLNSAAVSPQDEILADVNPRRSTLSSRVDTWTVTGAWHAWLPIPARGVTPMLSATLGVEVRRTLIRQTEIVEGTPQVTLLPASGAFDLGPVGGVGVTVRGGGVLERALVRTMVMDRVRVTPGPEASDDELVDPRVHEPTLVLELLWSPEPP